MAYPTTAPGKAYNAEAEAWVRRFAEQFDGRLRSGGMDGMFETGR